MPDCDYCGDTFDDEQSHLEHLRDEHEGELGAIDRRRVEEELDDTDDEELPTGPLVLGLVFAVAILLVGYVTFVHGSGGNAGGTVNGIEVAQMPGEISPSAHGHGRINVTIAGDRIDFSKSQYQLQADAFHFERGNGRMWHKHAPGVTLEYAMATLGIDVSRDSVTIDGTTYRESDPGTTVRVTVDGDPVDPETYTLEGASAKNPEKGDYIRIVVTTDGETPE